jgi:hypothetical protein
MKLKKWRCHKEVSDMQIMILIGYSIKSPQALHYSSVYDTKLYCRNMTKFHATGEKLGFYRFS